MRVPGFPRLFFFSVFAFAFGFGALLAGLTYIKDIVPVRVQTGDGVREMVTNPIFNADKPAGAVAFPDGADRINVLLLGIDYNYTDQGVLYTKGARSDTMMVVSLSKTGAFLNAVSVPRDTYILISEKLGMEKINAAYSYGGVKQAMETVSQFLGVPIHHYVIIKVYGAKKIFEALGGLPIDAEKSMDYDDNWAHFHVHIKKGPQVLNAEQAIGYSRFRMDGEGDRGRMRRQQQVIRAVINRLKDPSVVMRLPQLARAVKDTMETDLQALELLDLARIYRHFDHDKMRSAQLVGDDKMIGGQWMIIPYQPENQKIVSRLLKDDADPALKSVRVKVLNGSRDRFGGQHTADELTLDGFNVTGVADAPKDDYPLTQIVEHIANPHAQARLLELYPGATVLEKPDASSKSDFVLILGNDREPVPEAVRPAELKPNKDREGPNPGAELDSEPAGADHDPAFRVEATPPAALTPTATQTPSAAAVPTATTTPSESATQ
jgi:LCP family protein required for cell wall assembly